MAISETDVDSLGLVSFSYGNQGVNPDLVVESGCISGNGTVDCTGETVQARILNVPNNFVFVFCGKIHLCVLRHVIFINIYISTCYCGPIQFFVPPGESVRLFAGQFDVCGVMFVRFSLDY